MVRIRLIATISIIVLLQLIIPILGQMPKDLINNGIGDEYYAIQEQKFYEKALQSYNNGYYELALANIDKSIEYYKKLELFNTFIITENLYQKSLSDAYSLKAAILSNLDRFDESMIYSDEAINLNPENKYAWNNKGYASYHLGKCDEAIKCYDSAIRIDPSFSIAINNKNVALQDNECVGGSGNDNVAPDGCEYIDTINGRMLQCQGKTNNGDSSWSWGYGGPGHIAV